MHAKIEFGEMNGSAIGVILKELVRRATVVIRNERTIFEAKIKEGYKGKMDDVLTTADTKAQGVYLRSLTECFPDYGIIGEEDSLRIATSDKCDGLYFTVDPLDGTKAYVRRQSHGVGTMIALARDGIVLSAYVGDINTEEIYGYRPGSEKVHRITRLDTYERLGQEDPKPIIERHALLRNPADQYSPLTRATLRKFKNHEVTGSSIGIWLAQLWKGEIGAAFMEPGTDTPWDSTPIIGISKKLGYTFLKPNGDQTGWVEYEPIIPLEVYQREHETLIVHRSYLSEFIRRI